jgi:hypothetical protein
MSLRTRFLVTSAAVVLIVLPGMAVGGAGTTGNDDEARMIADATRTEMAVATAYNDRRWDDMWALFAEDALVIFPNRDPIRGRDAIIEFSRQVRDVIGPFDGPRFEHLRTSGAGGRLAHIVATFTMRSGAVRLRLAHIVAIFTMRSGAVRLIYDGLYERQPDRRVLMAVEHDSFRDPVG